MSPSNGIGTQSLWIIKKLNFDLQKVGEQRLLQLNEMDEFCCQVYENVKLYKERTTKWHDKMIQNRSFETGEQVLLFNSRLHLFPDKLKSRWLCPFTIKSVLPHGAIELQARDGQFFKVNGQRLNTTFAWNIEVLTRFIWMSQID